MLRRTGTMMAAFVAGALLLVSSARAQLSCDDGDPCTNHDLCGAVRGPHLVQGLTADTGCQGTPIQCPDDGDPCTINSCSAGVCISTPNSCDDYNPCTVDSCTTGVGCSHTPVVDDTSCDSDPDDCSTQTCHGGMCTAVLHVGACDDHNDCTTDDTCSDSGCHGTNVVDDTNCGGPPCAPDCMGKCSSGACNLAARDGESCNDGMSCTDNDMCHSGMCIGSDTCVGVNPCIIATCAGTGCTALDKCPPFQSECAVAVGCNTATGECLVQHLNEGGSCDDNDQCTVRDTCTNGACEGFLPSLSDFAAAPALAPIALGGLAVLLGGAALIRIRRR